MYNVVISENQQFSNKPGTKPPVSSWDFDGLTEYRFSSFIGDSNPNDVDIATTIKDYTKLLKFDFDNYYIQVRQVNPQERTISEWLTLSGEIADASEPGYEITNEASLSVTNTLSFNVTNLPEGVSTTQLIFEVYGKNTDGPLTLIDEVRFDVVSTRNRRSTIIIEPDSVIEFAHQIGEALPPTQSKQLNVVGSFTAEVPEHITLSGSNIVLDSTVDGVKNYSGSGSQTITFGLEISIEEEEDIDPFHLTEAAFRTPGGGVFGQVFYVYLYEDSNIVISPSLIEFLSIKDYQEAIPKPIEIEGQGSFTMTGPSWLQIFGISGGTNTTTKYVGPIDSSNLAEGEYEGQVVISFGADDYFVDVKLTVIDKVQTGFKTKEINFTKDRDTISRIYGEDTSKIEFDLHCDTFSFEDLILKTEYSKSSKGIFNNKSDFFLGNILDKLMPRMESFNHELFNSGTFFSAAYSYIKYYNPSISNFFINFIERSTGDTASEPRSYYNIKFIKGRRPSRFSNLSGIIDFKESPIRVTSNSIALLNFYKSNDRQLIKIYRNGVYQTQQLIVIDNFLILGLKLSFKSYTPGDIIEYRLIKPKTAIQGQEEYFSQKYIVFPENKQSYHIGWVNEHEVLEILEFTGDYQFKTQYDSVIATTFDDYIEQEKKYSVDRSMFLQVNSGWLLQSNQERIDSLMSSKKVWLIFDNGDKPISLIPRDSEVINKDAELEAYEYEIIFKINPNHELEDSSF